MQFRAQLLMVGIGLALAGCSSPASSVEGVDNEETGSTESALRNGSQSYEGYRYTDAGQIEFYNDSAIGKVAALAVFNKYYGCEVNEDAVTGGACSNQSAACTVAHEPGADMTTNPKSNAVARCSPTKSTNWPWRAQMKTRLGNPRDWNPNDSANTPWNGNTFHPFVAFNRNQQIWYSTFERGQLYAYDNWGHGGFEVYEVADVDTGNPVLPHVNWYSWYAKQIQPNGTNSFLGVPLSGHEAGPDRCEGGSANGYCMMFGRYGVPGAEGGPECLYRARTGFLGGKAVFQVENVSPWNGPTCAVPNAFQNLENKRL